MADTATSKEECRPKREPCGLLSSWLGNTKLGSFKLAVVEPDSVTKEEAPRPSEEKQSDA